MSKDEKLVKTSFDKRNSITIIAAPTGEGKTTTLYSVIDYLNKAELNIHTFLTDLCDIDEASVLDIS